MQIQQRRWIFVALPLALLAIAITVPARPTSAQITPLGQRGCERGTTVGGPNLVTNGDFAIDPGPGPGIDPAAGFSSALLNRGPNQYPSDGGGGGFSIQTGPVNYLDGLLIGRPFPGDASRDILPSQTYFYSNPVWEITTTEVLLWRQTVPVVGGTTYNFFAYFDNLLTPERGGADPIIELRVDAQTVGSPIVVGEEPDLWLPIEFAFTTAPGQTSVTLEIFDIARDSFGDDFGMTQINLKQCVSALGLAKDVNFLGRQSSGAYRVEYTIVARNFGVDPEPLRNVQITDDLAATFANAGGFQVVSLSSPTLTINPAFNGTTDTRLLAPETSLTARQTATITLLVDVIRGAGIAGAGPFNNLALGSATAGNLAVTDVSVPGTDPDPQNNGDPKRSDAPTPTFLSSIVTLPMLRR